MFNPVRTPLNFQEKIIGFIVLNIGLWSLLFAGTYLHGKIAIINNTSSICVLNQTQIGKPMMYLNKNFMVIEFDYDEWMSGDTLSIKLEESK